MRQSVGDFSFETKQNGVPVLSYAAIDMLAERIARRVQPELYTRQIDRTDLRKLLSVIPDWHYAGRYLSENGTLLGCAVFHSGRTTVYDRTRQRGEPFAVPDRTILVDRALYEKPLERVFRFTLSHEIGHALLHGAFCSDPKNMAQYAEDERQHFFGDGRERLSLLDSRRLKTPRDWVEWQANAFASAVLMPKSLVYQTASLVREEGQSPLAFANELAQTLEDVFRVSRKAAFYRMKELEILPPTAVQLENGLISPQ